MHNPITVEFVAQAVPAPPETVADRADLAQRLEDSGRIEASTGDVNMTVVQWVARINDVVLPVLDFSTEKLPDGMVAVSLVAVVSASSITGIAAAAEDSEADAEVDPAVERRRMVVERLEFAGRFGEVLG